MGERTHPRSASALEMIKPYKKNKLARGLKGAPRPVRTLYLRGCGVRLRRGLGGSERLTSETSVLALFFELKNGKVKLSHGGDKVVLCRFKDELRDRFRVRVPKGVKGVSVGFQRVP
jgi:hypothetical protein